MRASVEIVGTQQVIFDVDSKDLVPLEEFTVDVAVCLGKCACAVHNVIMVVEVHHR